MRSLAADRTADFDHVDIIDGRADVLPVADNALDGALSLQVFEYLADTLNALRDALRGANTSATRPCPHDCRGFCAQPGSKSPGSYR